LALGRVGFQQRLGLLQPGQPTGWAGQLGRELIATGGAVLVVLALVGLCRLLQHLRHLVFELGQGAVGPIGGVGGHLGAVQRDHAKPDHPGGGAQLQRLHEEAGQGGLMAGAEAGDGLVVGSPVGGQDAEGDVLVAAAFDLP
jgi:hypothetical protein